jgi:D-methionine transport system substrate-binding protein
VEYIFPTERKRLTTVLLLAVAATLTFAGCGQKQTSETLLRIGVTPVPAGEVIAQIVPVLSKQGFDVKVVTFSDYIQPNLALSAGELEANLYQNVPFMEQFNRDHGTHFVSVAKAYLPPMGLYPGRAKSIGALHDGSIIAIPNDPVNSGRGLALLQSVGLLKLKAKSAATGPSDIIENPKHLQIRELEAAQLPRSVTDVDAAVINANFALDAGLFPNKDALYRESPESRYVNTIVVNGGHENDKRTVALVKALQSEAVRNFIQTRYKGSVEPAF